MPDVVAGIALPEGDPGAATATASGFRAAAGGFEATGGVTERALGLVGTWQGVASVGFRDRCAGYEEAAAAAQAACAQAAQAVRLYARELEEARERVRELQRRAEECVERIESAEVRAAAARERENAARARATSAALATPLDAGSFSLAEQTQALDEAATAAAEAAAAESDAAAARAELERLRERAERERERVEQAGRTAAAQVQAAAGQLPTVTYPAPPAAPVAEEEEDKPFWEDAWDAATGAVSETGEQLAGVGKGFAEGVVGIGNGGLMLYRLSPANALIDRDSFEEEWRNVGDAAEFAWNHPGEFGKAVINWEDLANGRYGEWLGNLGPDAVVAVATAGTGTAATASTRAVRATDKVGDVAEAARDADRAADARRLAPPDAEAAQRWLDELPTRPTPDRTPADRFEIKHTGPVNHKLSGGGETVWADGFRVTDGYALEAKHIENAGRSPYVSDSGVPPAIRTEILNKLGGELERYGAVIRDTGTPARGLEIITNEPRSVHTFESLMKRLGVPGHVVVREP
jgi:uncharacterized protein YukE